MSNPKVIRERLSYLGKAYKAKHGANGFRYRNVWATGYDDLIFSSHEMAKGFAAFNEAEFIGPPKEND